MKLKRLIAITVVLATLLSCSCIAGSTVYADDADTEDYPIFHWDGMLIKAAKSPWSNAVVDTMYGLGYVGTSLEYGTYDAEGNFTNTSSTADVRSIWESSKITDSNAPGFTFYKSGNNSKGTVTTRKEGNNYYYEISYPAFRSSNATAHVVSDKYSDFNLSDDVYSASFSFRVPAVNKTANRGLLYHNVKDAAATDSLTFSHAYVYDAETEQGYLRIAPGKTLQQLWSAGAGNDVFEVEADEWYTVDTRYALVDYKSEKRLLAGIYVNGIQVACYVAEDKVAYLDGGLQLVAVGLVSYSSSANVDPAIPMTHFDDIKFSVLGDYANCAPSSELVVPPTVVTDSVEYTSSLSGTTLNLAGTITGFSSLAAGDYKSIVAIFGSNGRTESVISATANVDADYVEGSTRNVSVTATGDAIVSGKEVKVFFFIPNSFIPVLPNFSGTIN